VEEDGLRVGSCYGKSTIHGGLINGGFSIATFDELVVFSVVQAQVVQVRALFSGVFEDCQQVLSSVELQGILMEAVAGVCFPYLSTTASCLMQPGS